MALPELQTGGVDVSNTLLKLHMLDRQDTADKLAAQKFGLESRNVLSEISTREAAAPSQNMLRVQQIETTKLDDVAKAIAWVADSPEPDKAYDILQKKYRQEGISLPDVDLFYTRGADGTTRFSTEKFKEYSDSGIRARKLELDPSVGKGEVLTVLNKDFDPKQPESAANPKLIKQRYVSKGFGKVEPDLSVPIEPVIDPIQKEDRADKIATETARHNKEIEKAAANTEKRNTEFERHNKAIEFIMAKNAETAKQKVDKIGSAKIIRTVTTADGTPLHIMSDKSILTPGVDSDGQLAWNQATPAQMKGMTAIPGATDEAQKIINDYVAKALGGKVEGAGVKPVPSPVSDIKLTTEQHKALVTEEIRKRPLVAAALEAEYERLTGQKYRTTEASRTTEAPFNATETLMRR